MADQSHVVLLIHGTGAASEESKGSKWWQRGSVFWEKLHERFPDKSIFCDAVFHWSGKNLESDRRQAAAKLLADVLDPLEKRGQPYHLIGHSHGGTVIWLALREAEKRQTPLNHLRSWCTVGTPFFQYDLSLAAKIGRAMPLFFSWIWILCGLLVIVASLAAHFLEGDKWDPASISLGAFWVVLGGLVWWGARTIKMPYGSLSDAAMARYGPRWLGLRSADDEAINGLKHSFALQGPIVPRIPSVLAWREHLRSINGFFGAIYSKLMGNRRLWIFSLLVALPYLVLFHAFLVPAYLAIFLIFVPTLGPIFNRFVAPRVDSRIWGWLAGRLHGMDVPFRAIVSVGDGPVSAPAEAYIALPTDIACNLAKLADDRAMALVPKIRKHFGLSASSRAGMPQFFSGLGTEFTWEELIHTSYFANADVLELIFLHMQNTLPATSRAGRVGDSSESLAEWSTRFEESVRKQVLQKLKV